MQAAPEEAGAVEAEQVKTAATAEVTGELQPPQGSCAVVGRIKKAEMEEGGRFKAARMEEEEAARIKKVAAMEAGPCSRRTRGRRRSPCCR